MLVQAETKCTYLSRARGQMDLSGFKVLILMAQPQGEVARLKTEREEKNTQYFCFDIAAQFISSVGNVFIFSKPAESMDHG